MQLRFLGATQTVTGSKYLLRINSKNILIDCGLFQGYKELRLRNWAPLPINPAHIDAVLLTHAHIDHSGYLPLLVKQGFKGKIYATPGTKSLCSILLPDSGHLQEEEARLANKYGFSKHKPALPLYSKEEAIKSLEQFESIEYNQAHLLFDDIYFEFHPAGHIIGAAMVQIKNGDRSLLFTGDIGRAHDAVMKAPSPPGEADYLVIESTYGDCLHERREPLEQLAEVINRTIKRGGSIIIPAFAVGRAQSLLYFIYKLKLLNQIPRELPVFLDSPMAIDATKLLQRHKANHHLTEEECRGVCATATYINTADESRQLDLRRTPQIIIAASGMAQGGRILHHLKVFAPNPKHCILFTGYQGGGTRGARILNGEREIKIHGTMVAVNAEVAMLSSVSAHADYQEILDWLKQIKRPPKTIFITHGEAGSSLALKAKIEEQLGFHCIIPSYLQVEELE
ncbi:MBL fold metallo-hydrolase RNA specificity domain-containing protein [Legionella jordanis]|uniref:Metallo-beta lactamase family transporter protein n=1 Tax=Legionella jordanis TaxID=456 RepID=A0A0W0VGE3_9GAMM|nr:MBL fold metallo-hydrolase [Legionella jordanis]KTD19214.1 metallo-beta lactamase family transporter protein [Legionella jordanis]RMW99849.1 MBL fold metallo-hydrolase [Legionella jordanis]RMX15142.1 MBL fold metallo-hydrolase [Legionella jordanis]VEH12900.1 Metallo-beta-lactamase family protein, RNA-specific [Legionella jordanis]HAT8714846.1 MBL fold metallo-hydrolase [Legionella jordanis]